MKKLIPLSFVFLLCASLRAQNPSALYKKGEFAKALSLYKKTDLSNPFTLYNIANCQFKLGRKGPAILYYAKAFNILPRNSKIRKNFDFALKRYTGQGLIPKDTPKLAYTLYHSLSLNEIKSAAYISFWILCVLLSVNFLKQNRKNKFSKPAAYFFLFFVIFMIWGMARSNSALSKAGVIMRENVEILSGPGENFKTYATISEGQIVKFSNGEDDNYIEIGLPQKGIKGWIKKSEVEKI